MNRGFTLIELTVVLLVMTIAVGIVAPSFLTRRPVAESALATLIHRAQDIAASRQETIYLGLAAGGAWRMDPAIAAHGPLATGTLAGYHGPRAVLVVSPLGTCGFDARSGEAMRTIPLDPLTCELVAP